MMRVSDAVREVIESSALFQFGLLHRLLNLSKVASYIHPMVQAKTEKEVQVSDRGRKQPLPEWAIAGRARHR